MHHPPSQGQKLPAFFHGLTSWQLADSFQPKKKARVAEIISMCALRTMAGSMPSRGRLVSTYFAKQ